MNKDIKLLISAKAMGLFCVLDNSKKNRLSRLRKNLFRELDAINKELKRTPKNGITTNHWTII